MLNQSLTLAGVPAHTRRSGIETSSSPRFAESPKQRRQLGMSRIHLSCHGGKRGIALMSGEQITWYELRQLLVPVNRTQAGRLLLCMSSCRGLFGSGMALDPNDLPFHTIVGPVSDISFPDAAVGFIVFYHQLAKGNGFERAGEIMRLASGEEHFDIVEGEAARAAIRNAIAEIERGT